MDVKPSERLPEGSMEERIVIGALRMRFNADDVGAIAARAGCSQSTVRKYLPILHAAGWLRDCGRFGWWATTSKATLAYPEVERDHNPYAVAA